MLNLPLLNLKRNNTCSWSHWLSQLLHEIHTSCLTPSPSQSTPMSCNHATFLLVALPSPPLPSSRAHFPKRNHCAFPVPKKTLLAAAKARKTTFRIRASKDGNGESADWYSRWLPSSSFAADKVFRLIASATASPIGQFVSSPTTFLHSIDPRVKLVIPITSWWLFVFVFVFVYAISKFVLLSVLLFCLLSFFYCLY